MGVANTGLPGRVAMPTPTMLPCCPCSACPGCPAQRPAHCPGYRSRRRPAPSPGPKGYCQPQPRTPNRGTWDSPLCINARSAPDYQKCAQTFRPMLKGLRFTPPWGSMGVKIFFQKLFCDLRDGGHYEGVGASSCHSGGRPKKGTMENSHHRRLKARPATK